MLAEGKDKSNSIITDKCSYALPNAQYNDDIKAKAAEERENRLNRLRPNFRNLLSGNPNIHYYSTFKTAEKVFAHNPTWNAAKYGEERKILFEEHINDLKTQEQVSGDTINLLVSPFNTSYFTEQ